MDVGELIPPCQLYSIKRHFFFLTMSYVVTLGTLSSLESSMTQSFTLDRFEGKQGAGNQMRHYQLEDSLGRIRSMRSISLTHLGRPRYLR